MFFYLLSPFFFLISCVSLCACFSLYVSQSQSEFPFFSIYLYALALYSTYVSVVVALLYGCDFVTLMLNSRGISR
jgi:hypothetical protein